MTGGWAATNTLREWLRRSVIASPNEYAPFLADATDALALVEAALDAAEEVSRIEATGVLPDFMPLAAALRAVREGK